MEYGKPYKQPGSVPVAVEFVIITAQWEVGIGLVRHYCRALINRGFRCRLMMINEDNAKDLLIRYGVREGVVKIPLILMINSGGVRVISIDDLREFTRG
jgi:hypothetical protein